MLTFPDWCTYAYVAACESAGVAITAKAATTTALLPNDEIKVEVIGVVIDLVVTTFVGDTTVDAFILQDVQMPITLQEL